jgi:ubiquinone/menaquinone biosynthesis C-methylase UbiE
VGVDRSSARLTQATLKYQDRRFVCGAGESLPFLNETFDRVVCRLALPYMEISTTLCEIYRVLRPGGTIFVSVHPPRNSLHELKKAAANPKAILYRLYVIANGCVFHATGTTVRLSRERVESFQTRRGMRLALRRARFEQVTFRAVEERMIVEAEKQPQASPLARAA